VRTFFIAATGNVNKLRLVGLDAIEVGLAAVMFCHGLDFVVLFRK
jgi:hypothetical protein